jgi:hypothetical protein
MRLPLLLIKKYLPIFTSFVIFIFSLLALFLFSYSMLYFLIFSFLTLFLSLVLIFLLLQKEAKTSWPLILIFGFFVGGAILFSLFTENLPLKIFFMFIISAFAYIFLTTIFRFFYEPRKYPPYSMENMSFSIALLVLVLIFSDLFAMINFFNFSVWYSLIIVFLVGSLITIFIDWSNKCQFERKIFLLISLVMTELFWSFTLLPNSFYIDGVISGLLFFLLISLIIKKNKEGIITSKTIKQYILLGIIILFFIFILAKWR